MCPPSIKEQKIVHKISADLVEMRTATLKGSGRLITKIGSRAELDNSNKINNLLLQTTSLKTNKNIKETNSKGGKSSKDVASPK
jgi:hypothetical protein